MFEGLSVAMVTPFREGAIDRDATARLVEGMIEGGVQGLVVSGSTGEAATCSVEERRQLWAFVKERAKGRVWIVDFIFTSCGNVCPRMTARRVELQEELTDPRISFLSFSVDPERDTAATRKTYAAKNGIVETRWHFVSPETRDAALKLAVAMKIAGKPREADNPILHADRFLLIDATGRVRGIYHLDDAAAMSRLAGEAKALAKDLPAPKPSQSAH